MTVKKTQDLPEIVRLSDLSDLKRDPYTVEDDAEVVYKVNCELLEEIHSFANTGLGQSYWSVQQDIHDALVDALLQVRAYARRGKNE